MGLRSDITAAVDAAFRACGDLVEAVTYKSVNAPSYNPTTGEVEQTSTNIPLPRTIFMDFEQKEIEKDPALLTDMKLLLPTADLDGTEPKPQDIITDSKSRTWEIQRRLSVPADLITILQVRTTR